MWTRAPSAIRQPGQSAAGSASATLPPIVPSAPPAAPTAEGPAAKEKPAARGPVLGSPPPEPAGA